jgi:hypothetical protein
MKVFICWSGDRGLKFASACRDWIVRVVGDQLTPALSVDIEKGGLWFDDLTEALREARAGIVCLTPEGTASPWIHFEAGILAKALEVDRAAGRQASPPLRIFPFLFGVDGMALKGPLAAFQATSATDRDDGWRLIESILAVIPESDRPERKEVNRRFKAQWSAFQTALKDIEPAKLNDLLPDIDAIFRRKTFDESMYDCLTQGWLERYDAVREVQSRLHGLAPTVRRACRRFVADVFDALIVELNAYGMCLSVLIGKPLLPIDEDGRVQFDHRGVAEGCERRRKRIKTLVARLADDRQAPVFDEAFHFESAETFAERKRLVHRKTAELREDPERTALFLTAMPPSRADRRTNADRCRASDWDFDRIIYNVWLADWPDPIDPDVAVAATRTEMERAAATAGTPSPMALHYSLAPLRKALAAQPFSAAAAELPDLLAAIRELIKAGGADAGGQIKRSLTDIDALLEARPAATSRLAAAGD